MTDTLLTGSAVGIFMVYLGRTLYELAKQRNGTLRKERDACTSILASTISRPPCSSDMQKVLERQTMILERLSDGVSKANEGIAVLMDRRTGGSK